MSLNRDYLIAIREREAHQSIIEEDARDLNEKSYILDLITNKKITSKNNRYEHHRKVTESQKAN